MNETLKTLALVLKLQSENKFSEIDHLLVDCDPEKATPEEMTVLLRSNYKIRKMLPTWLPFLEKVKVELGKRKLNVRNTLRGLEET